jgi:hypothetical protein
MNTRRLDIGIDDCNTFACHRQIRGQICRDITFASPTPEGVSRNYLAHASGSPGYSQRLLFIVVLLRS